MNTPLRLLASVLLVGVALGSGVHYASAYDDHWPYPSADDLVTEYDQHTGADTLVFGTVMSVDSGDDTARIVVDAASGRTELTVREFRAAVQPGGTVQVHGVLRPDRVIDARSVVVVNPAGGSNLYKYVVSVVGALLVLVAFFGHWRIDTGALGFVAREDEDG